jgi:apolipoprotein N-acyltransferase
VDVLVNLTNNGWFGASSAQWQHAAAGVFRAVENGVPLVRATNNGLTCWVDATGRIRQWLGQKSGDVYGSGFLTVNVPLSPDGRPRTFYNRHGDVFGWSCAGVLAAGAVFGLTRHWRPKSLY